MDDEAPIPEDIPRYLLPDGCHDLVDALRRKQQSHGPEHDLLCGAQFPAVISISDPVTVRDLALALLVMPHVLVSALMRFNIFTTLDTPIPFSTASVFCSRYGVVAHKVI